MPTQINYDAMNYTSKIRRVKDSLDLGSRPLGKILGTSHATVQRWEKGISEPSEPQEAILDRLCEWADREGTGGPSLLLDLAEEGKYGTLMAILFCDSSN